MSVRRDRLSHAQERAHSRADFAIAIGTYEKHFEVLQQFLLSYAFNVLDPHECRLLAVTSSPAETKLFHEQLRNGMVRCAGPHE